MAELRALVEPLEDARARDTRGGEGGARLKEAELTSLAVRALTGAGLAHADAVDTARILVMAEMFGLPTHGLSRIESYGDRLMKGGIDAHGRVEVERVAP